MCVFLGSPANGRVKNLSGRRVMSEGVAVVLGSDAIWQLGDAMTVAGHPVCYGLPTGRGSIVPYS